MSVFIFFTFTSLVVLFGFIFVGLTIHHHWKQYRLKQEKKA